MNQSDDTECVIWHEEQGWCQCQEQATAPSVESWGSVPTETVCGPPRSDGVNISTLRHLPHCTVDLIIDRQ